MSPNRRSCGKGILTLSIMALFLIALCLLGGIAASIPARTAEIFGPPDLALSSRKLYQQSIPLLLSGEELYSPVSLGEQAIRFKIDTGESLDLIIDRLVELDLVQHPDPFRAYLIYSGIDTRIQAGEYTFSGEMSELDLAAALENSAPAQTTVSILPGWRAEEIAETFPEIGLQANPDDFVRVVQDSEKEGYLFPGTYPVAREVTPEELVDIFYQRFLSQITSELETQFQSQGLSIHEAVILASIVQREAVFDEEMTQIASVFLNRLQAGMNLAADPTIQYALGYNQMQATWWTNPLSLEDLKLPSSYNTYENPGLPPGPISNPGLEALLSVAQPAETAYLYFRAACDGSGRHLFSASYEEHLQNACP